MTADNEPTTRTTGYQPSKPPWKVLGYEVPEPTVGLALGFAGFGIVLPAVLTFAGSWWAALFWFSVTLFLFIIRNAATNSDVIEGLYDPIWGKHIRRDRSREHDKRMDAIFPKWFVSFGRVLYGRRG